MPGKAATTALDRYDRAILGIVQRDNKTPQRAIAEAVNLSTAAVQRRIAAMEKAGVTTVKSPGDLGAAIAKRLAG